eukprot:jgi/Chlat1/9162/Chrsp97S08439
MAEDVDGFLQAYGEKAELNQYWYSPHTIATLVQEIEVKASAAAFLSTPSLYFSLKDQKLQQASRVFDFDTQWAGDPNFVLYDFNKPEELDASLHHRFDYIVIDPPFITPQCWRNYAQTARLLASETGKSNILLSTIAENANLLHELLAVSPCEFKPSIPHLVYQYSMYTNYPALHLNQPNKELPPDD